MLGGSAGASITAWVGRTLGGIAFAHRPVRTELGWAVTDYHETSTCPAMREPLADFLRRASANYCTWNPCHIEPDDRNRVRDQSELNSLPLDHPRTVEVIRGFLAPLGLHPMPHLRLCLTQGSRLLLTLATFREAPYTPTELATLQRQVPRMQQRLALEHRFRSGLASLDALVALLDTIDPPAFLVRADGMIDFANGPGLAALACGGAGLLEELAGAARGAPSTRLSVTVVRSQHAAPLTLAIVEGGGIGDQLAKRVEQAAVSLSLGPRQAQVLANLASGQANKEIASTLSMSAATVEVHVTAILAKARADSRGRLIARFWTGGL